LGQYGELTVEQARSLTQEWLAQVRRGGDSGVAKGFQFLDSPRQRRLLDVQQFCCAGEMKFFSYG